MRRISIGTLIFAVFIPLLVGAISAMLSAKGMSTYGNMNKPPLSPPAWVFSVAWTILYIMMGLASYFIIMSDAKTGSITVALIAYAAQLLMNFMWSIIFFKWENYLFAFIWLMVMWCLVIFCAIKFYGISRISTYLFIPYILWLTFAAYLNFGSYLLRLPGNNGFMKGEIL